MRLNRIKLAGFKSFVDPATVSFPGNLSGIVGPNGCGKSNIIDAVRWVMGESSAKYLRGESMSDVIFNGSVNRKPSGYASIELHFDNSDGALGGMYAHYPEIIIRRQVNLEAQSTYYLNGAVCRRRDVTDIFRGTGLGPRSYAIIEQGTISRLIEAKPEELRIYLEEAAGISKYKERRRETELRLQHTRDNLARLNDIREELQKQLDHLSKQAASAEKYQQLKNTENNLRADLFGLRCRTLETEILAQQQHIADLETQFEAENAAWQNLTTQREIHQSHYLEVNEALQAVQKSFYETHTQLARLEAQLQHHREQKHKLETALAQIDREYEDALRQQEKESHTQHQLIQSIEKLQPEITALKIQLKTSQVSLNDMEKAFHQWQERWDDFNLKAAQHMQGMQHEQMKIQQAEKHLVQIEERIHRLSIEQEKAIQHELPLEIENLQKEMIDKHSTIQQYQQKLAELQEKLHLQREENHTYHQQLDKHRTELQSLRGRFASLQALQEAALGKNKESLCEWLKAHQLENKPRLAQLLQVKDGWELAVEIVLGSSVEAVCIESLETCLKQGSMLSHTQSAVSFVDQNMQRTIDIQAASLASQCEGPAVALNMLSEVYIAENIAEALEKLPRLALQASVITREGLWLGNGWCRMMRSSEDQEGGVILREKALTALQKEINQTTETVKQAQSILAQNQHLLRDLELARDDCQKNISLLSASYADLNARLKVQESQLHQQNERKARISQEKEELCAQKTQEEILLYAARESWQTCSKRVEENNQEREILQKTREEERLKLHSARNIFQTLQHQCHGLSTQMEVLQTQQSGSQTLNARLSQEISQAEQKRKMLVSQCSEMLPVESELTQTLHQLVSTQSQLEKQLQEKREQLSYVDNTGKELEKQQKLKDQAREKLRTSLEEKRLTAQSAMVRLQGFKEQLQEMGCELSHILAQLSPEMTEAQCESILEKTLQKIERLGAINLAAITEHAQQSERKHYLDQQHEDLMTALNVLEEAIRKIDQETRSRFKEVYEKVNSLFSQLFPRIFGGGQAYLELTGNDLLETGVNVIARPPGKRNSTIHLLSGGEKALTAIALVFAIFQLNPAPFCMLDEVDAPLDDANIGRFCTLVKEMSQHVQFIFISHNKLAIEMAEHLIGVTMNEPGVSRLVAVDVHAAMGMAAA